MIHSLTVIRKISKPEDYKTEFMSRGKISHKLTVLWIIFQAQENKSFDSEALDWGLISSCVSSKLPKDKVARGARFQVQTEDVMGGGVHGLDELRKPGYLLSQAELSLLTVLG